MSIVHYYGMQVEQLRAQTGAQIARFSTVLIHCTSYNCAIKSNPGYDDVMINYNFARRLHTKCPTCMLSTIDSHFLSSKQFVRGNMMRSLRAKATRESHAQGKS